MTATEATARENAPAAQSTPTSRATELAVLRDRLVAHAHRLSEIELRYLVQELGLAAEGEPTVTKYVGGRYKLSTDPAEVAPYLPLPPGDLAAHLREIQRRAEQPGGTVPAAEALERLGA